MHYVQHYTLTTTLLIQSVRIQNIFHILIFCVIESVDFRKILSCFPAMCVYDYIYLNMFFVGIWLEVIIIYFVL